MTVTNDFKNNINIINNNNNIINNNNNICTCEAAWLTASAALESGEVRSSSDLSTGKGLELEEREEREDREVRHLLRVSSGLKLA